MLKMSEKAGNKSSLTSKGSAFNRLRPETPAKTVHTQMKVCIVYMTKSIFRERDTCPTLLTNLSIEANSVDSDQTAPKEVVWYWSTLFVIDASKTVSRRLAQTTFVLIGPLNRFKF